MSDHDCSICGNPMERWPGKVEGYGNNAAPFKGRCCDACNTIYVIPARLGWLEKSTVSLIKNHQLSS